MYLAGYPLSIVGVERLEAAYDHIRHAEQDLNDCVAYYFPVGAEVSWDTGRSVQRGWVVDHGWFDGRLKVENMDTGKRYWIRAWNIVEGARTLGAIP